MKRTVLVVANQTLSGVKLLEAVQERAAHGDVRFVAVVPRNRPQSGLVVYDDAVRDAAQVRVDLAVDYMRQRGVEAFGEVGDPDPFTAAMDAIAEHAPEEIIVSTFPATSSGWLRRDLVERIEQASGLPVEHIVIDLEQDRPPFVVTLVVAARTARGRELHEHLRARSQEQREHLFIVVVPLASKDGSAASRARGQLRALVKELQGDGMLAEGMVGDPDPYDAVMNAVQFFRIDEIVISTYPNQRSGWLRSNLIERVRSSTRLPVEHVVAESEEAAAPAPASGVTP
ncbi:MAG: hypothetical protein ACR2HD_12145 [Solirubrobacteraceae bacterium]